MGGREGGMRGGGCFRPQAEMKGFISGRLGLPLDPALFIERLLDPIAACVRQAVQAISASDISAKVLCGFADSAFPKNRPDRS